MKDTKVIENKDEKVINTNNKVCAILYTITSSIWLLVVLMRVYDVVSNGEKAGWGLVSAISMVVVFGSCAITYFNKYRNEKKEHGAE